MIDAALTVVDAINADMDVVSELQGGVFAFRIPPEAVPPLALVMIQGSFPAAAPSIEWWRYLVTIDVHTDSPQKSMMIADKMKSLVSSIFGDTPGGVVADCQIDSINAVTDGAWTPTRYRQIVTIDLMARGTFEGG